MTTTPEQKRRQQAARLRAVQIIQAEHRELWDDAYRRAKAEVAEREAATGNGSNRWPLGS